MSIESLIDLDMESECYELFNDFFSNESAKIKLINDDMAQQSSSFFYRHNEIALDQQRTVHARDAADAVEIDKIKQYIESGDEYMFNSRNYAFTIYGKKNKDGSYKKGPDGGFVLPPITEIHSDIRYLVWQYEVCPKSGNLHIQGYAELRVSIKRKQFQSLLNTKQHNYGKFHCKPRYKTRDHAREYCMKSKSRALFCLGPIELGLWERKQGYRNDLIDVWEAIRQGLNWQDISEKYTDTFVKYHSGIKAACSARDYKKYKHLRRPNLKCYVYWGASGVGKTYLAAKMTEFEMDKDTYILSQGNGGNLWLDNYNYEKRLVIDEFDYGWIQWASLLRLLNPDPNQFNTKGGHVYPAWEEVIITSNHAPHTWYDRGFGAECELGRRFHGFSYFGNERGKIKHLTPDQYFKFFGIKPPRSDNTMWEALEEFEKNGTIFKRPDPPIEEESKEEYKARQHKIRQAERRATFGYQEGKY